MKYLDLFTGIGGFTLGIQQAYENLQRTEGIQQGRMGRNRDLSNIGKSLLGTEPLCIGFSEIDKYASKVYQHHFPTHHNYGNIKEINAEELPDFDLLVGGFPCQAFSIAGKRKGFDDTRGTLFFDIARILRSKQPRLFLLENVKGLLSHDNGNTFKTIISTLDELGYDLQWQVLNSKNHGVPQNRERIFIVGHIRGTSRPEVFPFGFINQENNELESAGRPTSKCLRARGQGDLHSGLQLVSEKRQEINQLNSPTHSNDRVYGEDGISPTLNTMQGRRRQPKIQQRGHGFFQGSESDIAPSLRGASVSQNVFVNRIRRLTPTECERLQGFPDGWTAVENTSDSQRYKMAGNAVTVNVIRDIMEKLLL